MNPIHYPSLDLCKKLTEIGFPETERDWLNDGGYEHGSERYAWISKDTDDKDEWVRLRCPSVTEMLDTISLPLHHKIEVEKQYDFDDGYWYKICFHSRDSLLKGFQDELLANALAEMVLWLYENNYISFTK